MAGVCVVGPAPDLLAGGFQNPETNWQNQTGFLCKWNEFERRHHAARRVLPAHQRLGTNRVAVSFDLRLIVQKELAALDGEVQVAFHLVTLAHGFVHAGREELRVVSACCFGVIHRGVGILHQRIHPVAVFRVDGNADTCCGVQLVALKVIGLGQ